MSSYWTDKRVLVTGGAGFIGSYVTEQLVALGAQVRITTLGGLRDEEERNVAAIRDQIEVVQADLTKQDEALRACSDQEVVLNLAAHVRGVGFNKAHPGTMFRDNMLIGLQVLEAAHQAGVKRFLAVSTAVVYPNGSPIPTPESAGFVGEPDEANWGYGWAKRMTEVAARAYAKEYGLEVAIARPYNAYGARDHFDPETGHVIPALITRLMNGENPLTVWGDGTTTRSFIYAEDFARGLVETTERYAVGDPVNIGSSVETSIRELAEIIVDESGTNAELRFDSSKPKGQPRSVCDVSKATEKVGFTASIPLREGIRRTIEWYRAQSEK